MVSRLRVALVLGVPHFDGDGDLDLLNTFDTSGSAFFYHRNDGTATNPIFVRQDGAADPFDGIVVGTAATVAVGDLDGAGARVADLVVGDFNGTLHNLQNSPAVRFVGQGAAQNPVSGIDIGEESAPAFADLDSDVDRDLVVGTGDGTLVYFRNNGTSSAPAYLPQSGTNPFASVDVAEDATPTFADVDSDGDLDLVVGASDGLLRYYRNGGPATAPVFTELTGASGKSG